MGGRRKKRSWWKDSAADGVGNAAEAVGEGCGCDLNLLIAFVLIAGVPLLLWAG